MFTQFAIFDIGTGELVLILAIVLLLFGGRKLPELSKSIGESLRELRKGINEPTTPSKKSDAGDNDKA